MPLADQCRMDSQKIIYDAEYYCNANNTNQNQFSDLFYLIIKNCMKVSSVNSGQFFLNILNINELFALFFICHFLPV
jgi:hypothetical protein